ncbi:MAG: hypothetical protein QOE35_3225 [Actinomycetota bacterium]|jgi:hypothetical protein
MSATVDFVGVGFPEDGTRPHEPVSYEQFGVDFIRLAVTDERLAAALSAVAGDVIRVGPITVGPAGAATVDAEGRIGPPRIQRREDIPLSFRAVLPVDLSLDVKVAGVNHHYDAKVGLPLDLTVQTIEPITLVIDVARVSSRDVDVSLKAEGMRARLLSRLGNVEDEIRRHVARFVRERVDSPEGERARRIEILPLIDQAWRPQAG